eukprot:6029217-Pleurochrysis_carterae.AAC.1
MEGDKGGWSHGKWHTGRHCKLRTRKSLPIIGSLSLFQKLRREHDEILEILAKSHPKRDLCGKYKAGKDAIEFQNDAKSVANRNRIHELEV